MVRKADDFLIFYHLIDQGSFSKAAEQVSLTKSVVSKRVTRLEQELGVQLIYRTTRKLTLTEEGEVFYRHAQEVYQSIYNANEALKGLDKALSGVIKISVPTISGELLLPDVIADFGKKYPNIDIHMDLDNRFVDLISEGYDFAIRTGVLPDSSNIARKLLDVHWVICAAPDYLATNGVPQTPQDLIKHQCLGYSYQETGAYEWLFKGNDGVYTVNVSGNFCTNNASALRKVALLGQGLVYVPKVLVAEDLTQGDLVEVLQHQVAKCLGIYVVYPYTKHLSAKTKLLIEHIYQHYHSAREKF
ncbi:LysR family transcriptional regulator [Vibrio sp. SCSIO 43136]|uniref:LysR family transcriptional regulator n=1 Tax=Vibrio sp. SCSIO 43136 TaxID=2819101 RepID=UPI0020752CB8|nr:LysR family transcriptional regulator [Vibrio sp. SCSIO 43136]USD68038.1 LysR family transcriptional regulator [Vibrio sp. SCSIO 43136]